MSIEQAWSALDAGDFDHAETLFGNLIDEFPIPAMHGIVRVNIQRGSWDRAQEVAEVLLQSDRSPSAMAVLGEILGGRGKRKQAESWLAMAVAEAPRNASLRTLLGEQRIRRGKWKEGVDDFVAGLSFSEDRTKAFTHTKVVLSDLVDALLVNKLSEADAMKFVNKLDYNISAKTPEMTRYFALVRRAISDRTHVVEPRVQKQRAPATVREAAIPMPPPSTSPRRASAAAPNRTQQPRVSQSPRRLSSPVSRTALSQVMAEDRKLNEELQNSVGNIGLPIWPSESKMLDEIKISVPKNLGYTKEKMQRSDLMLTSGSIASSTIIRRALDILLFAAAEGSSVAPELTLKGITQLEVMCWDGLLARLPPVPDVYAIDADDVPPAVGVLALGAFLGTTIERATDAVWNFHSSPLKSSLSVGSQTIQPFELASAWIRESDKDEVNLRGMLLAALLGRQTHRRVKRFEDPTLGLTEFALRTKLADLWTYFRSHPPEVSLVDVAEGLRPLSVQDNAIIFGLYYEYAPPFARGPASSAMVSKTEVPVAFLRGAGEFLMLASRKHLCRYLAAQSGVLDEESVTPILEFIDRYHRPGLRIVQSGDDELLPRFQRFREATAVRFAMRSRRGVIQYQLIHQPGLPVSWRLEIQK